MVGLVIGLCWMLMFWFDLFCILLLLLFVCCWLISLRYELVYCMNGCSVSELLVGIDLLVFVVTDCFDENLLIWVGL